MDFKQRSSLFLVFSAFVRVYHLPPLIILFVSIKYPYQQTLECHLKFQVITGGRGRGWRTKFLKENNIRSNLHVQPPPISDRQSKTRKLPVKALQLAPLVNDHVISDSEHFWSLTVNDLPLFLTSCKWPLDAFSDLYVRCVHYATKNIQRTLVTTWNYTWRNLDIACNEYLPLSRFV